MYRIHRRIGLIAFERGLLSSDALCDAMAELGRLGGEGRNVGLRMWFEHAWLDEAQMAEVLAEIGLLPDILVVGDSGSMPSLDASADGLTAAAIEGPVETTNVGPPPSPIRVADEPTLAEEDSEAFTDTGEREALSGVTKERNGLGSNHAQVKTLGNLPTARNDQHQTLAWVREPSEPGMKAPADASGELTAVRDLGSRDRYVVGKELGSGGGGRVLRAYDRALGRTVAMKAMHVDIPDPKVSSRFLAEAQATAQLEHPNIVPVYDFGTLPSGELFYTMREVRRHSLRDALEGLRRGSPHYLNEYTTIGLVGILRQVSQAVHYAHVRGVVHRDLKPDNIMVGEYGEVLVMDWGLARILERPARMNLAEKAGAEESGHTLGTPAYMPPEQARGELDEVDEQSDVYGLGAILYEILALEPPFQGEGPVETMWAVIEDQLVPPSARSPDRPVPAALERTCIKAMQREKSERHANAREFAEELEAWIEGLQPREAARRVSAGRRASQLYEELTIRLENLEERAREVAASIDGWEPIADKRELWDIEDQREQAHVERSRAFGEAVSGFTQALAYQPENADARRGLLNLYWRRLEDARNQNDIAEAVYFEALVRQFDDGRHTRLLDSPAGLELSTNPPGISAVMKRLAEVDRRMRPVDERALGLTPLEVAELEQGSYLIELSRGGTTISRPVQFLRGRSEEVDVVFPTDDAFSEDFLYIPGGRYLTGGDPDAFDARPQTSVHVDSFFCARFPVTFAEYLEWVNELWLTDEDHALIRAPQTRAEEGLLVRLDEETNRWVPDEILIEGPLREMYPSEEGHDFQIPVVGIRYVDALAYAEWRSERDGREYRLPTEHELEKAGRGVDGRFYPWGNRFDPTFCKMRFSRAEMAQLEPVGAFEADCSPYGVRDIAGGVQEWCRGADDSLPDQAVIGGSWNQDQRAARLASRVTILAAARSGSIGMRLVYDLEDIPVTTLP